MSDDVISNNWMHPLSKPQAKLACLGWHRTQQGISPTALKSYNYTKYIYIYRSLITVIFRLVVCAYAMKCTNKSELYEAIDYLWTCTTCSWPAWDPLYIDRQTDRHTWFIFSASHILIVPSLEQLIRCWAVMSTQVTMPTCDLITVEYSLVLASSTPMVPCGSCDLDYICDLI